jgi:peptide-methionine (S)-S-oxide reductase
MNNSRTHSITLGMGCYWNPDALFGQLPGITRTRTGFAGGTTDNPHTRHAGDHTEVVDIEFDPEIVSLETILNVFWSSHNPVNINNYRERLYQSLVLYRDPAQREVIQAVMKSREERGNGMPDTEVASYAGFYPSEARNQKFYLKRFPDAIAKLKTLFAADEELADSMLAARLNGLAKGYTNMEKIIEEIRTWPISAEEQEAIIRLLKGIKW